MEKKRLLIFHPTIAPYRIDFFNDLNEAFDTMVCLQYWNLKDQSFDYQKIYDQFKFKPVYLPEGGSKVKLWKAIIKQIRFFKPDVILTCEYGAITLLSLLERGVIKKKYKVVVATDDSFDMVDNGNDFTWQHRVARSLMSGCVDEVVVVSPQVEKWYQERYKKGIYFPIIVNEDNAKARYVRLFPKSSEYVEQYGLEGKKVLLSVSRLVDLKNLHRVIDAFAQTTSDATLVIVGDGPEKEALKEHAKRIEKDIQIVGRFDGDELYAWYNLASVFILASYKEPFGAVTNEALIAGCRVVVSERAGSSCLVSITNGEIINPMDVKGMSEAIDRQMHSSKIPKLNCPRKNLMPVSYKTVMNKFVEKMYSI